MSFGEFFKSLLDLSSPAHEKDTLSILPPFGHPIHDEEEEEKHMTSEHGGMDLSPAEEIFMPLTPSKCEEDLSDLLDSPDIRASSIGLKDDFYFPPNFTMYMEGELQWSRRLEITDEPRANYYLPSCRNRDSKGISWVFWSRLYDYPPPSNSKYNFMDLIPDVCGSPKVRDNIRHALEEMILNTILGNSLVQFWAPTTALEGRTFLTTQYQPFALGKTHNNIDRQRLCEYRMICREYSFYADGESGEEEQFGLPGRVFLNKFPESTLDVKHYTKNEYPQRDDAIQCFIKGSWALPVFEGSSQTCLGVLEIASLLNMPSVWHEKSFLGHLHDIFQKFGLRIFDGYGHLEMQSRYKNNASMAAFQELEMVCQSVCRIHNLPLALTWVSCSSCNDLLRSQYQFGDRDYFDYSNLFDFMEVSTEYYLRKGVVTGRTLTSPNLLYCSDVKQFSITEYPLVPYARQCKLSGWFTMCLRSSYTGNEFYVLEFFLPRSVKSNENVMTTISLILGTMEENSRSFKLASGQELREVLSVEVLDFQNVQKSRSVQMIKATRYIPSLEPLKVGGVELQLGQLDQLSMDAINNGMNVVSKAQTEKEHNKTGVRIEVSFNDILKCSKMSRNNAARKLKVSIARLKRVCRRYGIFRWPPSKINMVRYSRSLPVEYQEQIPKLPSDVPSDQASTSVANTKRMQEREQKTTRARIDVSLEDILNCSKMSRSNAARKLKVSTSALKRICSGYGIYRWPPHMINMARYSRPLPVEDQEQIPRLPSEQASVCVAKPGLQDANMVIIKAKYETYTLKFMLSLSSRLEDLKQEVAKRLNHLGARTYHINYEDEERELILIACDEDLQDCIHSSTSMGNSTIVVRLSQSSQLPS